MEPQGTPNYPYSQLIAPLVTSMMRASRSILVHCLAGKNAVEIAPNILNREFVWLAYVTPDGTNRHLVEAPDGMESLRNRALRAKTEIPDAVKLLLERHASSDQTANDVSEDDYGLLDPYVQKGPTRISSLLVESFRELRITTVRESPDTVPLRDHEAQTGPTPGMRESIADRIAVSGVPSPLAVVYDFLTVPDMPGTRAFALLACRNYLFTEFQLVPNLGGSTHQGQSFSIQALEEALSYLSTSTRSRLYSRGQDKLPPGSTGDVSGLLRHYLAMRRMLHLHFRSAPSSIDYFSDMRLLPTRVGKQGTPYQFEFGRSRHLAKLPEIGEIVNELWGLPIAIRGGDTLFRGGLKFSTRQGLVIAIHGGPGSGKTSLALALAAYSAPFGIATMYLTAEEIRDDLVERVAGLVPDAIKRLDFFRDRIDEVIRFEHIDLSTSKATDPLGELETLFGELGTALAAEPAGSPAVGFRIPKPCSTVIVLDGLHDLFAIGSAGSVDSASQAAQTKRLYQLVESLRTLRALVILTTGATWAGDSALDYLVDIAIRVSVESVESYGAKPDRRLMLSKARHQLCAAGTHGLQIAGPQGVRLSPQINYQLDRRSYWEGRLPSRFVVKTALKRARSVQGDTYIDSLHSVDVFDGSHVFINGQGSGGKAALALRLAVSPVRERGIPAGPHQWRREKILIVSFLYPQSYYEELIRRLVPAVRREYPNQAPLNRTTPRITVLHLYPGHLRPHNLYNRIEWELEAAELRGDPYSCVVIDGIHNVFLQFPEIERYSLFWPQIYSSLRSRELTTITTHTTLALPFAPEGIGGGMGLIDDRRSEPLRHALIQKSDFQFEVDPWISSPFRKQWDLNPAETLQFSNSFLFKVVSSLDQRVPSGFLLWSREDLAFQEFPYLPKVQGQLF